MHQIIFSRALLINFVGAFLMAAPLLLFASQALAHNAPSAPLDHRHCPAGDDSAPFVSGSTECPTAEPDPEPEPEPEPEDDGSTIDGDGGAAGDDDGSTINDDDTTASSTAIAFRNPIAFDTVDGLLSRILVTIQSIVAILAILFIVIGAIIYITSGGNQQRIELAKNAIFAALIGLALALAAPSFLKEIYTAVGGNPTDEITQARSLTEIALNITRFLLSIVGVLSIVMLVSGGIIYILSAGDQTRTDTAKRTIMYAIIGLVVALVSLVIVGQVVGVIGS